MTRHQGAPAGNLTPFAFQQLAVYIAARDLAQRVHQAGIGDPELRDQATRAAKSVFLNIAEGLPETGVGVRRRHFTIARNSLCEVAAAIDLAVCIGALPEAGGLSLATLMQRVGACLRGLLRG